MDIGTLVIKCKDVSILFVSQYRNDGYECKNRITKDIVGAQLSTRIFKPRGIVSCIGQDIHERLTLNKDSLIPPATDTRMLEVTKLSLDAFVRTQSNLLRNFHGFNFGDRDKDVWSEGNTVGGEELSSRPGGEKFEHAHRVGRIFHPRWDRLSRARFRSAIGRVRYRNNVSQVNAPCFLRKRFHAGMLAKKGDETEKDLAWNPRKSLELGEKASETRDPEALNIRSDPTRVIKKAEFATLHRLHLRDRAKGQSSENSAVEDGCKSLFQRIRKMHKMTYKKRKGEDDGVGERRNRGRGCLLSGC
ncbi:hypothetical protein B0H14DRAFT_3154126 [Mycena olivaceomarginata]|nr:hypothetical protein B0H14DRAFT_3154126 [Mycena olivaceomarginata]